MVFRVHTALMAGAAFATSVLTERVWAGEVTVPTMKLLLIEDDERIASVVKRGLEEARYQVDLARDGREGLEMALDDGYSLVILDLMLPGKSGWEVCETMRRQGVSTPILMLTARDAVPDRVKGLELGADDYLTKPFDFAELLARVRSLLRREAVHKGRVLKIADLEIDTGAYRVTRGGREVPLSWREYTLLEALAINEGRTLTRDVILSRVWASDETYSNTVDAYIRLLRKKIDQGYPTKLIHTVHGIGYVLRRPESDEE